MLEVRETEKGTKTRGNHGHQRESVSRQRKDSARPKGYLHNLQFYS